MKRRFALVVAALALVLALWGHVAAAGDSRKRRRPADHVDVGSGETRRARSVALDRKAPHNSNVGMIDFLAGLMTPDVCRRTLDMLVTEAASSLRDLYSLNDLFKERSTASKHVCGGSPWVAALRNVYDDASAIFDPMEQWDKECRPIILDSVRFHLSPHNSSENEVPARFSWTLASLRRPAGSCSVANTTRYARCVAAVQARKDPQMLTIRPVLESPIDRDLWHMATIADPKSSYNMVLLALTHAESFSMGQLTDMITKVYNWAPEQRDALIGRVLSLEDAMILKIYCGLHDKAFADQHSSLLNFVKSCLPRRFDRLGVYWLLKETRAYLWHTRKVQEYSSELGLATALFSLDKSADAAEIFSPSELGLVLREEFVGVRDSLLDDKLFGICMRIQERQRQTVSSWEHHTVHGARLFELSDKCTQWYVDAERALDNVMALRNPGAEDMLFGICTRIVGHGATISEARFGRLDAKCLRWFTDLLRVLNGAVTVRDPPLRGMLLGFCNHLQKPILEALIHRMLNHQDWTQLVVIDQKCAQLQAARQGLL